MASIFFFKHFVTILVAPIVIAMIMHLLYLCT